MRDLIKIGKGKNTKVTFIMNDDIVRKIEDLPTGDYEVYVKPISSRAINKCKKEGII